MADARRDALRRGLAKLGLGQGDYEVFRCVHAPRVAVRAAPNGRAEIVAALAAGQTVVVERERKDVKWRRLAEPERWASRVSKAPAFVAARRPRGTFLEATTPRKSSKTVFFCDAMLSKRDCRDAATPPRRRRDAATPPRLVGRRREFGLPQVHGAAVGHPRLGALLERVGADDDEDVLETWPCAEAVARAEASGDRAETRRFKKTASACPRGKRASRGRHFRRRESRQKRRDDDLVRRDVDRFLADFAALDC